MEQVNKTLEFNEYLEVVHEVENRNLTEKSIEEKYYEFSVDDEKI